MISVIIPVYNTQQYLNNCLKSVCNQTYSDLEILFIDDGSTDGSGEMLDTFAASDSRIRVIHQKNCGVSAARNRGIEEARGDYLSFIDSDDTLEPDMYRTLLDLIQKYNVPIAHCSYNRINDDLVKPVGNTGAVHVQSREEALKCFLTGTLFVGSCWTKLYARYLFDDIRFCSDIRTSEDMLVNFEIFSKVNRSVFQDVCKYNYMTSETSSCIRTPAINRTRDLLTVNKRMLEKNVCNSLNELLEKRILSALVSCYRASIYAPAPDKKMQRTLVREIKYMQTRGIHFSTKAKLEYFLVRYVPALYKFSYRIYDKIRTPNYDV